MKVLMLGWELPPHNSGGLGVACYQLCRAMSRRDDIDIEFVLPYRAEHNIDFMTVTAAHPQDVRTVQRTGDAYDSSRYVMTDGSERQVGIVEQQALYEESVARLVQERQFDIIHAHDWLTFRAGLRARQHSGRPLILHVHSVERDRAGGQPGNPLVREIESLAFQMADSIVAVSRHTQRMIAADYGIPIDKIQVVHNSIDRDNIEPLDDDNAYRSLTALKTQGWKVITSVGRLTLQKGLMNLLLAAREVIAREPKTLFLIVGGGEQYNELVAATAELGIAAHVAFAGFQRGKKWRDSFGIADLFVMPSVSEPFGLTALEAIGYGVPVLVSKQAGVNEAINNCLRVDAWDVGEMANQITAAIRNVSLRAELNLQAGNEFAKLSWNDAASRLVDIYADPAGSQRHTAGAAA